MGRVLHVVIVARLRHSNFVKLNYSHSHVIIDAHNSESFVPSRNTHSNHYEPL